MKYYYGKDKTGRDYAEVVEDWMYPEHQEQILSAVMTNDDGVAIEFLDGKNFLGYSTLHELRESEENREEPNEFVLAWCDTVEQAVADGMKYPFYVLTHKPDDPEDKYEAVSEEEYARGCLGGLIEEYSWDKFRITPRYFEEGEITAEEARKEHMWALADLLEAEAEEANEE